MSLAVITLAPRKCDDIPPHPPLPSASPTLWANEQAKEWPANVNVVVNGFVSNMDDWMVAADLMVTKAGPGTEKLSSPAPPLPPPQERAHPSCPPCDQK